MRILMLTQFYPPVSGGEERHVHTLSGALHARGHEVAVAMLWRKGLSDFEEDDNGVRLYRVRGLMQRIPGIYSEHERPHSPPLPDPEATLALRQVIKRERPDIIHAHNWLVHSFLPLKVAHGPKLVLTLHDFSFICSRKRLMRHGAPCTGPGFVKCLACAHEQYGPIKTLPTVAGTWVMRQIERRKVDMFLPVSRAVATGSQLAGSGSPYQVIPNFIPDQFPTLPNGDDERLRALPADGYLMFVGDLTEQKGIHVLLRAYSELRDAPPLVLIGRAQPDTPTTLPPNVVVLNNWPHALVMEAWRRSGIALVPSTCQDACPTVVMEAMACGKPVIGSRIGGIVDLIDDGHTGLIVPPGDIEALRHAMVRLLADSELRSRLGHNARRDVERFQASSVVPRIEQVYQRLFYWQADQPVVMSM